MAGFSSPLLANSGLHESAVRLFVFGIEEVEAANPRNG
jgi:hypothetical protein